MSRAIEYRPGDTVVVDLDGPLLDVRRRHCECYGSIACTLGFRALPAEEYWQLKRRGMGMRELLFRSGAEDQYDRFLQLWLELIESQDMLRLDQLQEGAAETLASWRRSGKQIVLATMRRDVDALHAQLRWLHVHGLFDHVVACNPELGASGKARGVAAISLTRTPAIWIGDTELDAQAARLLGCRVVLVTCGIREPRILIEQSPDDLVERLSSIQLYSEPNA